MVKILSSMSSESNIEFRHRKVEKNKCFSYIFLTNEFQNKSFEQFSLIYLLPQFYIILFILWQVIRL